MSHVIVTFHLDADDPEHETGITDETFEMISNRIAEVGGYNLDFELVSDPEDEEGS